MTPTRSPRIADSTRQTVIAALFMLALMLILASCGNAAADTGAELDVATSMPSHLETPEPLPEISSPDISTTAEVVFEPAHERGSEPFDPVADVIDCDAAALEARLAEAPTVAAAWAAAASVDVADIGTTIDSLEPAVLAEDTRVTNHAYRGGTARAFQATLEAGTAVLVDDAGTPRVRCACGNPLAEPREPVTDPPIRQATTTTTTPPIAEQGPTRDFCTAWAELAGFVVGGPGSETVETVEEYLVVMAAGFAELAAIAEASPGFPADGLLDLQAYAADLAVAAEAGVVPVEGDIELRDRVEALITSQCGQVPTQPEDDTPPTHDPEADPADPAPSANCGSMQFFLLIYAAEELGIDHTEVSGPFVEALEGVRAGVDPGPEFDVADLAPMIQYEEIGCLGAQAMNDLFDAVGMGHIIEGSELEA